MGRHSRKGRGGTRERNGPRRTRGTPEATQVPADRPYGGADAGTQDGTGAAGLPGARTPQHDTAVPVDRPHFGAAAPGGDVRGGHPEQREPGGGWGVFGTGTGPAAGPDSTTVGPVLGARVPGARQGGGPRQDYLDAFDDDVFAAGAPGGPGTAAPGEPADTGQRLPGQRQAEHDAAAGGAGQSAGQPPGSDGEFTRRLPSRGRGRTLTGIAAAAVTTVLAVVIASHVTDEQAGQRTAAGSQQGAESQSQQRGQRPAGTQTGQAQPSYDDRMAQSFPLSTEAKGSGTFRAVGGHRKGPGGDEVLRYRVDVEQGLPLHGELFAQAVHRTLNDKRSWAHGGERSFERVGSGKGSGKPDFVITLAGPRTTDTWCAKSGLDTSQEHVSCDSAATDRVMINGYRWAQGARTYGSDRMHQYRQMLINHEVGHRLGHDHVGCARQGAAAPVMMQQTKSLATDGVSCRPNAWPHPRG